MSYRYNPLVGQRLGHARFFQSLYEAAQTTHSNDGFAQHAALQEAIVLELVNTLRAFLSEIADNYGIDPNYCEASLLSSALKQQGIISPEVDEILLSTTNDGWIAALLSEHQVNCNGHQSVSIVTHEPAPLRFISDSIPINKPPKTSSKLWLAELSDLIDRHRDGLVEW